MKKFKSILKERKFINKMVKYIKTQVLIKKSDIDIINYNNLYSLIEKNNYDYKNIVISLIESEIKEYCLKYDYDSKKELVLINKISNEIERMIQRKMVKYLVESEKQYDFKISIKKIFKIVVLMLIGIFLLKTNTPDENILIYAIIGFFIGKVIFTNEEGVQ